MPGLIAIVGRPNVGKSALFNRIAGRRIAIVHDQPGVTRDRITAEVEWRGRPFTLVDTGGIGLLRREKADDVIVKAALEQVELAIEAANVIILVVNVQEGVVPLDREAAARLRRSGKPVLVAVNKVDTHRAEAGASEFSELGFDKIFPVSAIHGEGIEPLMNAAMALTASPKSEARSPNCRPSEPAGEDAEHASRITPPAPSNWPSWAGPMSASPPSSTPSLSPSAWSSARFPARPATRWTCRSKSKPRACGNPTC